MHTTSETASQLSPSGRSEWARPSGRPEWANFSLGLLAALAACVPFWVLVAQTVYWLI
jgi:hypothetical protein